jgi:hypothetical protein
MQRIFRPDDLQALNTFYKTPTGQRLLQKMPAVSQELVAVGVKFGQSVGRPRCAATHDRGAAQEGHQPLKSIAVGACTRKPA